MSTRDQSVGTLDIPVRTGDGPAPLSFGQELLWLTDRAFPGTTVWNVSRPYRLRGALDVDALRRAFDALAARHDALRTVFVSTIEGPRQVVRAAGEVPIRHVDVSSLSGEERFAEADRLARTEATTPFDLAGDTPLRVLLVRLADDDRLLCITTHHIVSDGWSKNVMFRDLSRFYSAFHDGVEPVDVEPLPIGWSDYAAWERSEEHQAALADGLAYWRAQLRAAPASLELPTDRARPRLQGFQAERSVTTLPRPLVDGLLRRARENDATLYMSLLTAYVVLLHRYSGQDDIVVGSPIVGRMHEETEALIGFFTNTLVLRNRVDDDPTFAELLARVRETCLDAYDRQEIPVEQLLMELQKDRQLTFAPLFNVILTMEDVLPDELAFPDILVEPIDRDERATKFDLTLYASAVPDGLQLTLWYRTDLFARQTADRMLGHLRRLIEASVDDPSARVSALPILTETERRVATAPMVLDPQALQPVHVQFAETAARSPRATAIVGADEQLTYAELDARAEVLATALRRCGARPGSLVGLGLERSVDAVVGMLGILKAGAAYVPLAPDLPPARTAQQVAESGLRLCVTTTAYAARFPGELELVQLDRLPDADEAAVESRPAGLDDLAYVIFTSGSTGTPKGVAVTHRNLAAYTSAIRNRLGVTLEDPLVFATVTSPAADLGNTAIFPALTSGGTLAVVPPDAAAEAAAFAAWIAAHPIDVLKITPVHLGALLGRSEDPRRLPRRWLILGGEACPWELAERVRRIAACRVLNHYGPTETTVGACAFEVGEPPPADERPSTVPIGFPLADACCYVLDPHGELVPAGVPGELYVGGAGVAQGYLNRPDLTAERFLPDPFGAGQGARMYRTGDRVRRLPGGELEFLGRLDGQVKVRGYRVELGEIESVLREHPAVAGAAAVFRTGGSGEPSIVAYLVVRDDGRDVDVRAWLADRLPDYMLPATVVPIESLPLTANGKIDRAALPDPALHARAAEAFVGPRTPTEEKIAAIWADVLGVERVGVTADFLALGFHSILAIRALDTLGQAFGIRVPIRSFFEASTIEELAVVVDTEIRKSADQELESTLALLDGMSDEDVESLLVQPAASEERT